MKLIITGATGSIGGGALQNALSNGEVTSVLVFARRDIGIQHPKLKNIIKKDFLRWEEAELDELKGAEGCVWALGAPSFDETLHNKIPTAAREAFYNALAKTMPEGKQFRFVLLSGGAQNLFETPNFWNKWIIEKAKPRMDNEKAFVAFEKEHQANWRTYLARPWYVYEQGWWGPMFMPQSLKIRRDLLGAALVDAAVNGGKQVMQNDEMKKTGMGVLARMK